MDIYVDGRTLNIVYEEGNTDVELQVIFNLSHLLIYKNNVLLGFIQEDGYSEIAVVTSIERELAKIRMATHSIINLLDGNAVALQGRLSINMLNVIDHNWKEFVREAMAQIQIRVAIHDPAKQHQI